MGYSNNYSVLNINSSVTMTLSFWSAYSHFLLPSVYLSLSSN